jgi:hypothetical protein
MAVRLFLPGVQRIAQTVTEQVERKIHAYPFCTG